MFPIWLRSMLFCTLIIATGCNGTFTNIKHPPKGGAKDFTTGSEKYPPKQVGYQELIAKPSTKKWGDPVKPPPDVPPQSGYDYMMEHKPAATQAGHVVVQRLVISGIKFRTTNQCGDTPSPIAGVLAYEYFKDTPANDGMSTFFAGEMMVVENRAGTVGYFKLPGTPPAVDAGENAKVLDAAYLNGLTPAEKKEIEDKTLKDAKLSQWRHYYEYDGCHGASPTTSCGQKHCLRHTAEQVAGGAVTASGTNAYQGEGKQW